MSSSSELATLSRGGRREPDRQDPEGSPERIGSYRIVGLLGQGGMGRVYEAEQASPRRRVALKVMRGGHLVDEVHARLFAREVETLARLKHPNIAAIYESGHTEDGQDYFAMELVRGETLDTWMRSRPSPPSSSEIELRLRLFSKIAGAVHYAHQRGVIHRDLKPTNIIVTEEESATSTASAAGLPSVKILDFGLARIADSDRPTELTEVGEIRGTLPYMSPEQARGDSDAVDVRTDVYALGILLYELLSGQRPYDVVRASLMEAVRVICETEPRALREASASSHRIDLDLETIARKALEKAPDRRYASAAALAEDVERYLVSQPILARPPSVAYQLGKFARRHRALVGAAAVSVLALVVSAAVSVRFGLGEAAQRREAEATRADLEKVADFQAGMLRRIDPEQMGAGLMRDLLERVEVAVRADGGSEEDAEAVLGQMRSWLEGVNATDLARTVIDANVLAPATAAVQDEFSDNPKVAASLHFAVGGTYRSLGMPAKALPSYEQALELRRQELGPDHRDTLRALSSVGIANWDLGRFDTCEKVLEEAVRRWRDTYGPEDRHTLQAQCVLGVLYGSQGRNDEAQELYTAILPLQERVLGPDHEDVILTLSNLSTGLENAGHYDEAAPLLERVLKARRRDLGPEHPQTLDTMTRLAEVYQRQGRGDEAVNMLRDTVATLARVRGALHPDTLESRAMLATVLKRESRFAEAEAEATAVLDATRESLGTSHPETLDAIEDLAIVYATMGRHDAAEPLFLDVLERSRQVLGPDHPTTIDRVGNLAVLYWFQGRLDEVEPLFEEVYRAAVRTYGPDHQEATLPMVNLAVLYTRLGRLDEAGALLDAAYAIRARELGDDHPETLAVRHNLAGLWYEQGRLDEAATSFTELVEARTELLGQGHPLTLESQYNLALVLRKLDRAAEAEAALRANLATRREVMGSEHPATVDAMVELAGVLADGGRTAEAAPLVEEALTARLAAARAEDPDPGALDACARLLLTAVVPGLRDPQLALELALEANERTGRPNPEYLDTLAGAYMANGDRMRAATTQRAALEHLPEGAPKRAEYRERLAEYEGR